LFGDEQGSAQIMMPATIGAGGVLEPATAADAANVQRTAYEPYGARRGEDLAAINRGWLGQTEDAATGLTYLNARYYDPALGRFLSPDPLMNPGDPRTLDPYRYADNNPVVYKDDTGLSPSCGGLKPVDQAICYAQYGAAVATNAAAKVHQQTTVKILQEAKRLRAMANLQTVVPTGARNVPNLRQQALQDIRGGAVNVNEYEVVRRAYTEARWHAAREVRRSKAGGGQNFWDGLSGTDLLEANAALSAIWDDGADLYQGSGKCAEAVMECFMNANFDFGAITVGHTVLYDGSFENWELAMVESGIDEHEYAHVQQVELLGGAGFYALYGASAVTGVIADFLTFRVPDLHDSNPFEKWADDAAGHYCDNLVWSNCGVS
jgi:RHS repeat-associated protein